MNFKSLGLGIALTCGTFAFSSTINASPTQAATVGSANFAGLFSFENQSELNPATETLNFRNPGIVIQGDGVFAGATNVSVGTVDSSPFSLLLNRVSELTSTSAVYTANLASAASPFLNFSNGVQFFASSGAIEFLRATQDGATTITGFSIPGTLSTGENATVNGSMTGQQLPGFIGSYSYSIVAKDVPEPLTILGSVTALGMGTMLKKKSAKKQNKEKAVV